MEQPRWTQDTVRLSEPQAMRALAHPVRLRLLGQLRRDGPCSVGMLAEALDEAPASVSYHLTTLAKYGFVVQAPEKARDRRERWWRATASTTSYHPAEHLADLATRAASTALRGEIHQSYLAALTAGMEIEPQLDPAWVAAATHSDTVLQLDVEQLAELRTELDALFDRWTARSGSSAADTAAVMVVAHAFRREP